MEEKVVLSDIDTAFYLDEFKQKYFRPMESAYQSTKGVKLSTLKDSEVKRLEDIRSKYFFLAKFVASIEATLEQNMVLKHGKQ